MTDTKLGIAIADEAGIHDAPTVVTWTEIFNLIDAARDYERKACAAVCDQMQENYKKFYRVALDDQPYDPAHCALVIRERSNVEFSGTPAALSPEAPLERRVGPGAQED